MSAQTRALMVREAEGTLRTVAFREWASCPPTAVLLPCVLFQADRPSPSGFGDLGWGEWLPNLEIVPFEGGHVSCLDAPHAAANGRRLLATLDRRGFPSDASAQVTQQEAAA